MPATESYNREDQFGPMFQVCEYCTQLDEIGVVYELPYGQQPSANPTIRRAYLDDWVRRNGGLGTWNASTASITVSGGGDPMFHGVYDYVGHYAGKPVYQKGNYRIANIDQTWMLFDWTTGQQYFNGNGGYAYPSQVDWWSSMFGNVYNVPTFTRGWGGSVAIPRWPKGDVPPGVSPLSSAWTQQNYSYQPFSAAPTFATTPPVITMTETTRPAPDGQGGFISMFEEVKDDQDSGTIVRGIDMMPAEDAGGGVSMQIDPPVPLVAVTNPDGTVTIGHQGDASIFGNLVAADGTIFGFSPWVLGAVAVGALFLFSGGKK